MLNRTVGRAVDTRGLLHRMAKRCLGTEKPLNVLFPPDSVQAVRFLPQEREGKLPDRLRAVLDRNRESLYSGHRKMAV